MDMKSEKTVLIFDSGVGGLSVYQELQTLLPQLDYLYLFDNAAYPYGELDGDVLIQRVQSLISEYCQRYRIDLIVIACNTASTLVLPHLRAKLAIPVVGVVPAIKPASLISEKGVGLIATPATVSRRYTQELIKDFANGKEVKLLGSTKLVDMAERKLRGIPVDSKELAQVLAPINGEVDTAVLGCTHFPLLKEEIQVIMPEVTLIDSGQAIAKRVSYLLQEESGEGSDRKHRIFCSAPPFERDALNETLNQLGFSDLIVQPSQDV
ncbi:glutamate racemase [Vibrio sp. SCSIO 43132]|uniref:glutamate racemase n=1 Tax=Vibrio sp. SCSIO 43132 TaxID=2779363 RepID=UPI003977AB51